MSHMISETEHFIRSLPVYNTFREEKSIPLFTRQSVVLIFIFLLMATAFLFSIDWDSYIKDKEERVYDTMNVTVVDFAGDLVSFSRVRAGRYVEIDEVFGNQYLKKDAKEFDPDRDMIDPRIGTAVIPAVANTTAPIDLSPEIEPEYPSRARSSGIEGIITLELIIADDGKLLRARPVGRKLGNGLEESAVRCYYRKKFKPSIDSNGKPITVKIFHQVRFKLL